MLMLTDLGCNWALKVENASFERNLRNFGNAFLESDNQDTVRRGFRPDWDCAGVKRINRNDRSAMTMCTACLFASRSSGTANRLDTWHYLNGVCPVTDLARASQEVRTVQWTKTDTSDKEKPTDGDARLVMSFQRLRSVRVCLPI